MINRNKYIDLLNGTVKDVDGKNTIMELLQYVQENKPKSILINTLKNILKLKSIWIQTYNL